MTQRQYKAAISWKTTVPVWKRAISSNKAQNHETLR